uniref:Putative RPA-interacting protein B n=1 Tax=Davidia involucrata TaxID=16924 RepID=A0A5B6ZCI5_DAVIN
MAGDEDRRTPRRASLKTHLCFNNYPNWKAKLRENCCKRVREDRTRLLWKLRLPESKDQSLNDKDFIKSTFQDIVTDEFKKIKDSSLNDYLGTLTSGPQGDDALWEYDGIHTAYQGECEEILLEMQRIFYEDLRMEPSRREPESCIGTWEDEEDEYLARAVYEHLRLNNEQAHKVVWCPICKQGELQENCCHIYCTLCELKLNKDNEMSIFNGWWTDY